MLVYLFVFKIGSQQCGVNLVGHILSFLLLECYPLQEIPLQSLFVLLLNVVNILHLRFYLLQFLVVSLIQILQLSHLVSYLVLLWKRLALLSINKAVYCVLSFYLFQLFLQPINFRSDLVDHFSQLLSLHHFILFDLLIFLHSLVFPVSPSEHLESVCMVQ